MKKILMAVAMLSLVACNTAAKKDMNMVSENKVMEQKAEQVINFYTQSNQLLVLKSSDNFETAVISTQNDSVELKRVESGSGILLVNDKNNIGVHFKEGTGKDAVLYINGTSVQLIQK